MNCTCYDPNPENVHIVSRPMRSMAGDLIVGIKLTLNVVLPGRKGVVNQREVLVRTPRGLRTEVHFDRRDMPHPNYSFGGHRKSCPMYAPARLPLSKKRRREALAARVDRWQRYRGKPVGAGWYKPFKGTATNRRERRGETKPR